MIETELTLRPTQSVDEFSTQLCTLEINSTFQDNIYQNSNASRLTGFDIIQKTINVQIDILDGNQNNIQNFVNLYDFPLEDGTWWTVNIDYHHKPKDKPPKVKTKTVQMEINIEPKPINPIAIT